MIEIQFKHYPFQIKQENDKQYILDIIRRRYVILHPEEWVRQHIIHHLVSDLNYPKGMIAVEKKIVVNRLIKRYDIVVYDRDRNPWMLIECKESKQKINNNTLRQLLNYQSVLSCPYWVLSNGNETFCALFDGKNINWLSELPLYNQ